MSLEGWIEIFSIGTHQDASGKTRNWSLEDLTTIAQSYNPKNHEAPIVLGHPKDNSPAFGWVEKLKVEGGKLLAKLKAVDSSFQTWVNEGRYKKRSISLYPDHSLRHVGFLGGQPPAVKGLKDFKFPLAFFDGSDLVEYEETCLVKEESMNEDTVNELKLELKNQREALDKLTRELKLVRQEKEQLLTQLQSQKETEEKNEVEAFIEEKISEGKLLPLWKEKGLGDFMLGLQKGDVEISFSEGEPQKLGVWFCDFLEAQESHQLFTTAPKPDSNLGLSPAEKIGREIAQASGALNQSKA